MQILKSATVRSMQRLQVKRHDFQPPKTPADTFQSNKERKYEGKSSQSSHSLESTFDLAPVIVVYMYCYVVSLDLTSDLLRDMRVEPTTSTIRIHVPAHENAGRV